MPHPRGLPLRLDWFVARQGSGYLRPRSVRAVTELLEGEGPSDHAPLALDLALVVGGREGKASGESKPRPARERASPDVP
jgi:hypothetical protein